MPADVVAGVDLGGTKIYTALASRSGAIESEVRLETEPGRGMQAVLRNLFHSLDRVLAVAGVPLDRLGAIGVGAPGPLDIGTGVIQEAPNLGWKETPLARLLAEKYAVPVFLDNDANLAALGEKRYGAGRDAGDLIYITVSTGVGAGLIINDRIYHGHSGAAGEIGHISADPEGPLCGCGRKGCLETLASGTALARQARQLVESGAGKRILEHAGGNPDRITARIVGEAALKGDDEAMQLVRRIGACLGAAIAGLVGLLNPSLVVIGGGVSRIGPLLFDAIEAEVMRRVMPASRQGLRIVPAALGDRSGVMGAIALAREHLE
jgi:glucokinase